MRAELPRLAVATHFQATDDTIRPAFDAVRTWYAGPFSIVTDLVVINVSHSGIRQRRGVVSDYALSPPLADPRVPNGTFNPPAFPYPLGFGPLGQFSPFLSSQIIAPCSYDPSGWECTTPYSANNPPANPPGV